MVINDLISLTKPIFIKDKINQCISVLVNGGIVLRVSLELPEEEISKLIKMKLEQLTIKFFNQNDKEV